MNHVVFYELDSFRRKNIRQHQWCKNARIGMTLNYKLLNTYKTRDFYTVYIILIWTWFVRIKSELKCISIINYFSVIASPKENSYPSTVPSTITMNHWLYSNYFNDSLLRHGLRRGWEEATDQKRGFNQR